MRDKLWRISIAKFWPCAMAKAACIDNEILDF
jgi:hypothetical protein